ncbi:MAG: hypothetical protein GX878_10425 [Firmicutes bacterium]|nr:hypothetical protein [Bacillota bacterium]
MFLVRSGEQHYCPCCGSLLKAIGSRRRGYIKDTGEHVTLMIRRLGCKSCKKVHHELPDILVPYKRYCSQSIEAVITGEKGLSIVADESTINRWKQWFRSLADYFLWCLISIVTRFGKGAAEDRSESPGSSLQRIWSYVGDGPGWLSRIVRPVVNTNYWV